MVIKSTVPPGTADRVAALLDRADVAVVANPEFVREGHAVEDFLRPHRVVVGCRDERPAHPRWPSPRCSPRRAPS